MRWCQAARRLGPASETSGALVLCEAGCLLRLGRAREAAALLAAHPPLAGPGLALRVLTSDGEPCPRNPLLDTGGGRSP